MSTSPTLRHQRPCVLIVEDEPVIAEVEAHPHVGAGQ